MAKISGVDGACTFDSGTIKITNWALNVSSEVKDTTDSGDSDWKTFLPSGWKEAEGTFEGFVETGDAGGETVGGAAASLVLTAKSGVTWTADAIITAQNTTLEVVGTNAVKVSYSFKITGSITAVNA